MTKMASNLMNKFASLDFGCEYQSRASIRAIMSRDASRFELSNLRQGSKISAPDIGRFTERRVSFYFDDSVDYRARARAGAKLIKHPDEFPACPT